MIICTLVVAAAVFIAMCIFRKQAQNNKHFPSMRSVQKHKEILKMIDERLGDAYVCKTNKDGVIVGFNSDTLFDAIDTSGDGVISYEELDKAMALTGDQLTIFISKMNSAGGTPGNCTTVSRECFVRHFFKLSKQYQTLIPLLLTQKTSLKVFQKLVIRFIWRTFIYQVFPHFLVISKS